MTGRGASARPQARDCVLRSLLDRRGSQTPDAVFATFAWDAPDWTFGDALARTRDFARALKSAGVSQGDHVLSWQPNGPRALLTWLATNYLGAVYTPLNLAYRGGILAHAIALSDAGVMVVHPDLVERLGAIDTGPLRRVIVDGEAAGCPPSLERLDEADLVARSGAVDLALEREIEPFHTQSIIYTSGTTGPSKAVLSSYLHLYTTATTTVVPLTGRERSLVHSPLFHVTGMAAVMRAVATGGSIAVLKRFNTGTFWQDVRRTGATYAVIMGSMATFLLKLPPSEDEAATPLKSVLISPLTSEGRALARRIGADFHTVFNMSETSRPLMSGINPEKDGTCGRPRAGVDVRIVDANDLDVAPGEIGELIVRTDEPWTMLSGYHKNPEATAAAWRNGWFHTGDGFRMDADGDFRFVDRIKDAIRRRGENISSHEVEIEVASHPDVQDCAAIGVRSELSEDEVLIAVEIVPGRTLDPAALIGYLRPRMPHYMVPRYVRIVDGLPRTPTLRVQKHLLRRDGVTPDTWDREAAGIVVRRDRIGVAPHGR